MKTIQPFFVILAVLASGVAAGKHRMLREDALRLFGGRVWRGGSGDQKDTPPRALRQQGDADLGDASDDKVPHYEAEPLNYFKKEMDLDFFEWINPDEIVPGGVTCGFMKPSLGSRMGETYPSIEVYVCARFADTQPAAKGNFFVHCGGPLSTSSCGPFVSNFLNEENNNDFNIWSIDQRGIGRSSPSVMVDACALNPPVRDENGNITNIPPSPEPTGYTMAEEDVESMKAVLEAKKQRNIRCWQHPEFHLQAEQEDGSVKEYHFLQYSGTRQLAEDIERMRLLINAPYMHLLGYSYGTTVMATHSTMFPDSVGLFYIDSSESPNLSHYSQALSGAINADQKIDYAIFSHLAKPGIWRTPEAALWRACPNALLI